MQLTFSFSCWHIEASEGILGRQYDNLAHQIVVVGSLPEGYTWDMLVECRGKYNVIPLTVNDTGASATLTADQLAFGDTYYAFQLRGTSGEIIHHTNAVQVYVPDTIVGPGTWPVLPTEFSKAEANIKELNAHPPVPGSNGYWLLWDLSSHSYQESDLPVPVGPAGPPNVLEIGTVETLAPGQPATAQITGEAPNQTLSLGIPQGQTGQTGATPVLSMGQVETLEPGEPATAELTGTPEAPVLSLGIPQGQPGKDGVQLEDSAVTTTAAWSSKKIVDTLCPAFTVSGNPVICNPVEDYPLSAVVTLEPKQAGSGDPSPENVRPITGWDGVQVTRCGKNLLNLETQTFTGNKDILLDDEIPPGSYTLSANVQTNSGSDSCLVNFLDSQNALVASAYMPVSDTSQMRITLSRKVKALSMFAARNNADAIGHQATLSNIQLELGSTPTAYEPYQGNDYTLTLPETIYGGTVDAVSGVGSKTWGYIASYNGESLPGEWISNRDVYSAGTTPTTGAQVAYKLATPEPFQATGNQPIPALAGQNTVYTDGNSLAVSGRTDLPSTIQTMQAQITALQDQATQGGTA